MRVQIRLHETNMLKNIRYAFTNKYTVVSELMQNARRAGASYVAIDYDREAETLTVRDSGCGIADFQQLFTFGESGWDYATIAAENAFGVGFTKSLYSAKHCTVLSKGKALSFDTEEALAQIPIEVKETQTSAETVIILEGVALEKIEEHMPRFACGFPIKVVFNGKALPRPYAIDKLGVMDTEIGRAHVAGLSDGQAATSMLVFLQGFVVHGDYRYGDGENIIHLDTRKFHARLPDRDKLTDEDEQLERIDACLREVWKAKLSRAKSELTAVEFVERYFEAASRWRLVELFDDVPALPASLFERIVGYPIQEGYRDPEYLKRFERTVSKEDIEQGRIKLVEMDSVYDERIAHWMYARGRGLTVFESGGLTEKHWAHPFVRQLCDEECEVEILGETVREKLEGTFISPDVAILEAYAIRVGEDRVVIRDEGMYCHEDDVILVPENETSGQAVRQVSDYVDSDEHWHHEHEEGDANALKDLVLLLRAKDPKQALESLLADLKLEKYPSLRGKVFTLKVGSSADRHLIELLA
jgi:Histidine kinase-, DNA gyrase B-, and HSP90-like ATPase